jgi:hypothetical protein
MKTFFASPDRSANPQLTEQVSLFVNNPLTSGLLELRFSLLAIRNVNRQILAVNDDVLQAFEISGPEKYSASGSMK